MFDDDVTDILIQSVFKQILLEIFKDPIGFLRFDISVAKLDDVVGITAIKSHLMIPDRDLDLVAVVERIIGRNDVGDITIAQSADQNILFQLELIIMIDMPIITSSALIGDRTFRLASERRFLDQSVDDAERVVLLLSRDLDISDLAFDQTFDENDQFPCSGYTLSIHGHIYAFTSDYFVFHL